jgi:F1F0 ATPase subunit 2
MDAQAMMTLYLSERELILLAGAGLAAGALIGAFHFLALRWNVRMFAAGQSLPLALALQLVRFAAIGAVLAGIAAHFGALPLLAATGGILAARRTVARFGAQP